MRNPFTRPRTPDAATLHAQQQAATLQGQLTQALATIATLQADNAALRRERDEAQRNYEFYFDEYRRTCTIGGKHQ
jgi:hypothetical protein